MNQARLRVAMIDSGFDRTSSVPAVGRGAAFATLDMPFVVCENVDDHDRIGHGTACTHILLRAAPELEVVPIRVFGNTMETSPAVVCAALSWIVDHQAADVVNLSLATSRMDAAVPLYHQCARAVDAGIIVVASVHNYTGGGYPAIFDHVIGVGVSPDREAWSIRIGESPECLAPASDIPTTGLGGVHKLVRGTSYAAPIISACVARTLAQGARSLRDVREALRKASLAAVPDGLDEERGS